ncbi:MAG: CBS domain-containing protein [Desulfobacterota bacterium]|nr:CBS domain-containing protein [Thermodesulfobacteriota bacterium]MDW8002362.1 CBS domain-containing protein [Deltaproteobacteria bacterium]
MLVRDVMTTNVITVPSNTPLIDAERIMQFHRIERLPIVDKGKLVGIITKNDVLKASPSSATSLSRSELLYLLAKLTVKEIMKRNVVTVPPDMPIEQAVALAQAKRVGALVVVENDRVVGIVTTNDIFYKVVNPLFGIGEKGTRIIIYGGGEPRNLCSIMNYVCEKDLSLKTLWALKVPDSERTELVLHFDRDDVKDVVEDLKKMGFEVEIRPHEPEIA